MSPYKIFLRLEAAEAIRVVRGVQQTQFSAFIDSLGNTQWGRSLQKLANHAIFCRVPLCSP